jgi:DNA-binding Xre family transcriptional regulator
VDNTLIRWKLREVMDHHGIKSKDLAVALGISPNAVTNLRDSSMPRVDGERLNSLLMQLNHMRKEGSDLLTPVDLIEYSLSLDEAKALGGSGQ